MGNGVVCQLIDPGTVFKNERLSVLKGSPAGAKLFYFGFPSDKVVEIKRNGLLLENHSGMGIGASGARNFDSIVFSDAEPASGGVFVISVNFIESSDTSSVRAINLKMSVPPWFACNIYVKT
jgi:hypothetical protein